MQSGQTSANGQGSSSGEMSNDQVLSEAMEVFNRSVQSGTMPGSTSTGTQGQSGPLDRTASASSTGSGGENDPNNAQNSGTGQQTGSGETGQMPAGGTTEGTDGTQTAGMEGTEGSDAAGQMGAGGETGTGSGSMGSAGQVIGSYGGGEQAGTAGGEQNGSQRQGGMTAGGTGNQGQGNGNTDISARRIIVIGGGTGVMTEDERVGNYDRELEEQMRVFDGIILGRRQETIARGNEEGAGDISASGAGAYGTESGFESAPLLTTASVDPNNNKTNGQLPDAPSDNRQGDYQNQSAPNSNIPPDISDGSDDDIVARQLREAAIAETDPVLREKLWDEYRKYKEGVQARR